MPLTDQNRMPLVSVVIPCYNHGSFLLEAIQSVWQQNYTPIEIIVVDDGSSDNTKEVSTNCKGVKYIYQQNQGLSAARNTGIKNSYGEFLVFLDADDWLLQGAISFNAEQLLKNQKLAFISGGHDKVFVKENKIQEDITEVNDEHYCNLLKGNYIGMHATVMYRRRVFDEMQFDTSLKMCEDYDLYLKIARKYPVAHHTKKIAAYRLHTENMSNNISKMLTSVLFVLNRQKKQLVSSLEKKAFKEGQKIWKEYYCKDIYRKLVAKKIQRSWNNVFTLLKYRPSLLTRYILRRFTYDKKNTKKIYTSVRI